MTKMLEEKVIIVAGGNGLIGKEFIKAIVENGGTGIIADIDEINAKKTETSIKSQLQTDKVDSVKLDINSKKSILNMIKYAVKKYGKIDGIVNSAYPRNKNFGKSFEDTSYNDFCENVNLQLGGSFLVSQQLGIFFKKQGYGNIINVSSIYGVLAPRFEIYGKASFHGIKMTVPIEYAAIKSAIIHMTKFMAKYYKNCNIRANCITPGGVFDNQPTEFLQKYNFYGLSKGMIDAQDLKGALVYLLSDWSKCVNGQNIVVDDGWTL
jgi:NAD(P)-dependent dehydrogenase (short-subunit alcohol dehydrogenase family)